MLPVSDIIQQASVIPSWTSIEEREKLVQLAQEVPVGGSILEIGCLYGGATALFGIARPDVDIVAIDNFSWSPEGYPPVSRSLVCANMTQVGVENVRVVAIDSGTEGLAELFKPDLLWIDGGHSYEFIHSDLVNFGPRARVVSMHDYNNPEPWMGIRQATDDFLSEHPEFYLSEIIGMVAVLRRNPNDN